MNGCNYPIETKSTCFYHNVNNLYFYCKAKKIKCIVSGNPTNPTFWGPTLKICGHLRIFSVFGVFLMIFMLFLYIFFSPTDPRDVSGNKTFIFLA